MYAKSSDPDHSPNYCPHNLLILAVVELISSVLVQTLISFWSFRRLILVRVQRFTKKKRENEFQASLEDETDYA